MERKDTTYEVWGDKGVVKTFLLCPDNRWWSVWTQIPLERFKNKTQTEKREIVNQEVDKECARFIADFGKHQGNGAQ